jgi:hypothetical protein
MKRLAARAPDLDIFSQSFVLREDAGWQITDAGRALLSSVEAPAPVTAVGEHVSPEAILPVLPVASPSPLRLVGLNRRRPRRSRPADRVRASAA